MTGSARTQPDAHVTRRGFLGGGLTLAAASGAASASPDQPAVPAPPAAPSPAADAPPFVTSGVIPRLGVSAGLKGPRSEAGIGALMPWGNRLWFITYTSHTATTGSGTGLYWVDGSMTVHKHPASVVGT